jgi:hypothetical protein
MSSMFDIALADKARAEKLAAEVERLQAENARLERERAIDWETIRLGAARAAELVNALLAVQELAAERHIAHAAKRAVEQHQAQLQRDLAAVRDLLSSNQQAPAEASK